MWTPKYENGCLIMLKYALEPLYAPEPLCDCLHQVVTLCKMADFQNRLISRIFGVFSSGFLHTTTLIFLYNRFVHGFGHFNFSPKLTIFHRL